MSRPIKVLGEPQIDLEEAAAAPKISRKVARTIRGRRKEFTVRTKIRTVIQEPIPVMVFTQNKVNRNTGRCARDAKELEPRGQIVNSAKREYVTLIVRSGAALRIKIKLVVRLRDTEKVCSVFRHFRKCVRSAEHEPVVIPLLNTNLQRVVCRSRVCQQYAETSELRERRIFRVHKISGRIQDSFAC